MRNYEIRCGKLVVRAHVDEGCSAEDAMYIEETLKMWQDYSDLCEEAKIKYPEIADKIDNLGLLMDDECLEPADVNITTAEDIKDSVYTTLEEFGEDSLNFDENERVIEIK